LANLRKKVKEQAD